MLGVYIMIKVIRKKNRKHVTNYSTRVLFTFLVLIHTLVPNPLTALSVCRAGITAVLLTQFKVWPVIDSINFSFVPEPLRVLFCSLVTLFWNIYISGALAGTTK